MSSKNRFDTSANPSASSGLTKKMLLKTMPDKQKGAAAIEYAVIAALIVVALWGAVSALGLGEAIAGIFEQVRDALVGAEEG